jgi:hypothetical protein
MHRAGTGLGAPKFTDKRNLSWDECQGIKSLECIMGEIRYWPTLFYSSHGGLKRMILLFPLSTTHTAPLGSKAIPEGRMN